MPGINRPDLARIPVNSPVGYIGPRVLPPLQVMQSAGTLYYADIQADSAVQTGRSSGAAPTAVVLAPSNTSYSAVEDVKRYRLPYEQIKNFGGEETGLRIGAKAAKRSVMRGQETEVADLIFTNTANAAITGTDGSFLTDIETAKQAIRRAEGLGVYLICGDDAFWNIVNISEVTTALGRATGGMMPAEIFAAETLARLLKIDGILIGDRAHWGADGTNDYSWQAALVMLPNPDQEAVMIEAQIGRNVVYYPTFGMAEDGAYWPVEVADNPEARGWDIDVCVHNDATILNGEGIQNLAAIDGNAGHYPTTTTTTTTT